VTQITEHPYPLLTPEELAKLSFYDRQVYYGKANRWHMNRTQTHPHEYGLATAPASCYIACTHGYEPE